MTLFNFQHNLNTTKPAWFRIWPK